MRAAALLAVLAVVLAASALDLTLGIVWVLGVIGILVMRRSVALAAPLVLLACVGLLVAGIHYGWFPPPAPGSYGRGWVPPIGERGADPPPLDEARAATRARIRTLAGEEARLTGAEIERRAGAFLALARRADGARGRAPGEVAQVEEATRRLARTLSAPEFRDLEARRARAGEYLAELDARAERAETRAELDAVAHALDPATMAPVSLRPVREDLGAARRATAALLRALGVEEPAVEGRAEMRYVEGGASELRWRVRRSVSIEGPARILRIEAGGLDGPAAPARTLALRVDGGPPRGLDPGPWTDLTPGVRGIELISEWTVPARPASLSTWSRPVAYSRVPVDVAGAGGELLLGLGLDGPAGLDVPLTLTLPAPRLTRVELPRHALHAASWPGSLTGEAAGDVWVPEREGPGPLALEIRPASMILRSAWFSWVRGYVYRPNAGTLTVVAGLAALTLVLARRSRPAEAGGGRTE